MSATRLEQILVKFLRDTDIHPDDANNLALELADKIRAEFRHPDKVRRDWAREHPDMYPPEQGPLYPEGTWEYELYHAALRKELGKRFG